MKGRLGPLLASVAVVILGGGWWGYSYWQENRIPPGPPHVAGRILFSSKKCVRCHRIAGVGGRMGPDLTVVALRRSQEWMDAYLQDPRAVKSDSQMPQPRLNEGQRAALLAYLATLNDQSPPEPPEP